MGGRRPHRGPRALRLHRGAAVDCTVYVSRDAMSVLHAGCLCDVHRCPSRYSDFMLAMLAVFSECRLVNGLSRQLIEVALASNLRVGLALNHGCFVCCFSVRG